MRQGQSGKHVTISSKYHAQKFTGKIPFDWSFCASCRALTVLYRRTFPRGMHFQLFPIARKAEICSPTQTETLFWAGLRHNGRSRRQVLEVASMTADSFHTNSIWASLFSLVSQSVFHEIFSFQTVTNQYWLIGKRQAMPSLFLHTQIKTEQVT